MNKNENVKKTTNTINRTSFIDYINKQCQDKIHNIF